MKLVNDSDLYIYSEAVTLHLNTIFNGLVDKAYIIKNDDDDDEEGKPEWLEKKAIWENNISLEHTPVVAVFNNGAVVSFSVSEWGHIQKETIEEFND